ncbi:MAG: C39 family peptidase, partial [Firmicutes bacterium]|nr:C39 family peptidase [Bacillota bacterium]
SLMEEGASKLGLSVYAEYPSAETITAELQDGKTIICSVFDGDFTSNGHFIVLAGIADDGKVIVRDPNSIARTSQTWDAQRIADQTAEMWVYE